MKVGVILRVSKPARMGIDDAPLYPPAAHGELLPVEHTLALIPTLISDGDPTAFCRVERKRRAVRLEKRQAHAAKSRAVAAELRRMAKEYQKRAAELTRGRTDCGNLALGLGRGGVARPEP